MEEKTRGTEMLRIDRLSAGYEGKKIIEEISLRLGRGELISIVGPSGIGKSTLFHAVAGLLRPMSGEIYLEGEKITGQSGKLSYMLQKDLLLPFKSVAENVALPLLLRGMKKKEACVRACEELRHFGLEGTEDLYPSALSGGMRQRAALCRTYLTGAKVSLLDEPFSALDSLTRQQMWSWFLHLLEKIDFSVLLITHDIHEALLLSDRIYVLRKQGETATLSAPFTLKSEKAGRELADPDLLALHAEILHELQR